MGEQDALPSTQEATTPAPEPSGGTASAPPGRVRAQGADSAENPVVAEGEPDDSIIPECPAPSARLARTLPGGTDASPGSPDFSTARAATPPDQGMGVSPPYQTLESPPKSAVIDAAKKIPGRASQKSEKSESPLAGPLPALPATVVPGAPLPGVGSPPVRSGLRKWPVFQRFSLDWLGLFIQRPLLRILAGVAGGLLILRWLLGGA